MSANYDRAAAIAYARQWAHARNPAYYDFDALGGDCTNFISQCLYAGCGVMNRARDTGWYYSTIHDRSAAWSGVEYLYKFLTANTGQGPRATEMPLGYAQIGDVIQLSFDGTHFGHSLLVVETAPEILIAAHTDDSLDRPLSTYNYARARLLCIG